MPALAEHHKKLAWVQDAFQVKRTALRLRTYIPGSTSNPNWVDIPTSYHNGANGLAYADGHSEIKRWKDPAILPRNAAIGAAPKDKSVDLKWLKDRSTY